MGAARQLKPQGKPQQSDQSSSSGLPVQRKCACEDLPSNGAPNFVKSEQPSSSMQAMRGHDFRNVRVHADRREEINLPSTDDDNEIVDIPVREHQSRGGAKQFANVPESNAAGTFGVANINGDGGSGGGGSSGGGGAGGGGGAAQATASICDQPLSMNKVTSGNFLGGKTMDDYYPDISGGGYWAHGGTGGPFDTGSQVGSNVQLWGDIRIPCDPSRFQFAQTVKYTLANFNGVADPLVGVVQDDIAASRRDFSRAPSRQEFGGGGGWVISMADPPSAGYGRSSNIEFDREFVTTLIAPTGRQSVTWSTSIRVVNGTVTRNTIS